VTTVLTCRHSFDLQVSFHISNIVNKRQRSEAVWVTSRHVVTYGKPVPSVCDHVVKRRARRPTRRGQSECDLRGGGSFATPCLWTDSSQPAPRTLPDIPPRISLNRMPSTLPSPLPLVPLAPAQVASLRGQFHRRRSSYPPVTTPGSSAGFPWVLGGTPSGKTAELIAFDNAGFGSELSNEDPLAWDALISFDQPNPAKLTTRGSAHTHSPKTTTARAKAEVKADALPMSPGRIAQFGSDLAWKTILGSVVEVEGVGEVGVCRVLLEVWKRGGGETVGCMVGIS
jgi:hypothetical protein